jgi:REP element-mobilizing transposase RayT
MPRPLRPNLPETFHHVMNRAIDRGPAFRDDSDRVEFGQRLADIFERFGVVTHAYCLMTTHFHLLLECPSGALSEAMQRLSSMYTRHVNDRLGRDGAIFRGRFASRLIDSDEYLLMACRYIHRNALDLPGVTDVSEYRWSSHRTYLGLRAAPPWMRTDEVLGHWNGSAAAFDEFIRRDVADGRSEIDPPRLQAMVAACAMALDGEEGAATRLARLLVIGWATNSGVDPEVVMRAFGMTRGAVHSASHRARTRIASAPSLELVVGRAADLTSTPARSRLGSDPWRDQSAARAAS